MIRFKNSGTGLVKFTHVIKAVVSLILIVDVAALLFTFVKNQNHYTQDVVIACFVWHNADRTAAYFLLSQGYCAGHEYGFLQCRTGTPYEIKRTHLSGISILSGLFWVLVLFILIISKKSYSGTSGQEISRTILWVAEMEAFIMIIKQFMVAACNRNLKKYNSRTDGWN